MTEGDKPTNITTEVFEDQVKLMASSPHVTALDLAHVKLVTPQILLQTLQKDERIFIVERSREVELPLIQRSDLIETFGPQSIDLALTASALVTAYPLADALVDNFADHDERRTWRDQMQKEFGDIFVKAYEDNNQFRKNLMTRVVFATLGLAKVALNNERMQLQEKLGRIVSDLLVEINDPGDLYDNKAYKGKLKTVCYVVDKSLDVLNLISTDKTVRQKIEVI